MDSQDKVAGVGLSVSAVLFSLFYRLYKNRNRTADQIKSAKVLPIDSNLVTLLREVEGNSIAYATVEGIVHPTQQTIASKHGSHEGIIQQVQLVEHKSKRIQGYWSDVKRIIRDTIDIVPFSLTNPNEPEQQIHITEALDADFILDELSVTFDVFEPEKANILQIGIDRMFGEVTKGFQETEKMLLVGTSLVGIGEVCLQNNQVKLVPPSNGSYILSKLSRNAIIRKFESQSFVYRVITTILGTISTGLTLYLIWKFVKRYLEQKRNRRMLEEIRAAARHAPQGGDGDAGTDAAVCVICLDRPRDIVVLDCGHFCMCSHCAEILHEPRLCPVCRTRVVRFLPLYRS